MKHSLVLEILLSFKELLSCHKIRIVRRLIYPSYQNWFGLGQENVYQMLSIL